MPRTAEINECDLEEVDGLCVGERRQKWAREGNFQALWQVLLENEWSMIDQADCFRLLLQAIEVAARNDPRKFSADIFARVIGFTSYLVLRSHFQLSALLDRHDIGMRNVGHLPVPREATAAIPDLIQLQEHVAAMMEAQSRTNRMWKLAGKTQRADSDGKTPDRDEPSDQAEALPFRVTPPPMDQAAGQA